MYNTVHITTLYACALRGGSRCCAPTPRRDTVPSLPPKRGHSHPYQTLAARQRGKGEPCPLRGSVGLWSRVKVKPLRGRPDGANLDTSKRRNSRRGYGGLPPSQREGAQHDRRCCIDCGGRGSPSRLDCIFAADAILSPSSGLGGVVGHLRAV